MLEAPEWCCGTAKWNLFAIVVIKLKLNFYKSTNGDQWQKANNTFKIGKKKNKTLEKTHHKTAIAIKLQRSKANGK